MDDAIVLTGIVLADGSLHLSGPLPLPQCEVEVIVRPLAARAAAPSKLRSPSLPRINYQTPKAMVAQTLAIDSEGQNGFDEYEYGGSD